MQTELDLHVSYSSMGLRKLYGSVSCVITRITPEHAAEMLSRNTKNRSISRPHVISLVKTMTAKDMVFNGQAIVVSEDGELLDGQHRLKACVESGIPFDTLVVYGVKQSAFATIDSGRKRSVGDFLSISGEQNVTKLSGAVQALVAFVERSGVVGSSGGGNVTKLTPAICQRVLDVHPGLRSSVCAMRAAHGFAHKAGYLLHYLFGLSDQGLSRDFAEILTYGSEDHSRPFHFLREQVLKTSKSVATTLLSEYAAKAIKAFNAEKAGRQVRSLRASGREGFPMIDGLDYEDLFKDVNKCLATT